MRSVELRMAILMTIFVIGEKEGLLVVSLGEEPRREVRLLGMGVGDDPLYFELTDKGRAWCEERGLVAAEGESMGEVFMAAYAREMRQEMLDYATGEAEELAAAAHTSPAMKEYIRAEREALS